jgi:hypothetical protein
MTFWILLLAFIAVLAYLWRSGALDALGAASLANPSAPGCSACARKNVAAVE